jgi:hypothetical protein
MASVWDPEPETPTEAARAEEVQRNLREERTIMDLREAEIRAQWEAEDARRAEEEELRGAGWELRRRILDHLRDTPLRADPKADWRRRLEENPTSADLARLRADVANFHGSSGLLPEVMLREFLTSFEAEVDQLRQLVLSYERKFS